MSYHCLLLQVRSVLAFFLLLLLIFLWQLADPPLGQIQILAQSLDFLANITNWSCFKFKAMVHVICFYQLCSSETSSPSFVVLTPIILTVFLAVGVLRSSIFFAITSLVFLSIC